MSTSDAPTTQKPHGPLLGYRRVPRYQQTLGIRVGRANTLGKQFLRFEQNGKEKLIEYLNFLLENKYDFSDDSISLLDTNQ